MNDLFLNVSGTDLQALIAALNSGRLTSPYSTLQIARVVPAALGEQVRLGLHELHEQDFTSAQIATVLGLISNDRKANHNQKSDIDLVTSGPEAPGITNRDTAVVVRELFAHAQTSVLVVGYAVYQGQRVFAALAERMEQLPELNVKLFLNISRPDRDDTPSEILISRFGERFKASQWPSGCRLPEVYYDPRSVADEEPVRSSLHAKCIVVDAERVFVSSANFTDAGQRRNIEVGLNVESSWLAQRLIRHFQLLNEHRLARRAF